ncbi:LysR family transcriptional regulator [Kitasatospora aureofaciens]|uniref:LysR family transcriptional regulator n=1 Tax=Kitasatospora aureofaciens TaxID=1894 RepID=UPI001C459E4F|nr:LysR family transcriptional regulator [Kitasatospora aureofaciens]MBV6699413.1 LysR family transcriptional regulator [Kitasatospora aureofaciens]
MELELRHLRVLCAIADTGSVGRAAAVLGASQPATSTQLRRIERYLGAPLFERTASGVVATCFGVEVLTAARDLLARADRLGRRPAEEPAPVLRELRLAATLTPTLPGLLSRARHQRPDLQFTVSSVYRSSDIVDLLEQDRVDAAIAVDYPGTELAHSPAVAHRGIVTEPAFVALPASHPLRHHTEVALADLAGEAWFLTPDDGAGWHRVFHSACAAAGFAPATVHEFLGGRLELQDLIAAGLGVSVVQPTTRPLGDVVVKPLAGTPIWVRHLLAWRPAAVGGEVVETLFGAAGAAYRELVNASPHYRAWASRTYRAARP